MEQEKLAEEIGTAIIKRLHEYNEEKFLDDTEYIPFVKRVIEAIKIYMEKRDITSEKCDALEN